MQNINASDHVSSTAKQAIDTALTNHKSQMVGGTTVPQSSNPIPVVEQSPAPVEGA